jgi:hypothetical protein
MEREDDMVRRPLRPSFGPDDEQRLMQALREARAHTIKCSAAAPPHSERYAKCHAVTTSIDALAAELTGDPKHFHTKPHG